jgi:hypothetical protein
MDEYLKKRLISTAITFCIIVIIIVSMFAFILYKQQSLAALWSFTVSIPLMIWAFLVAVNRWNNDLRKLAGTEFILMDDCIAQSSEGKIDKSFKFTEIAVVNKRKFGTTLVKGNWLTKVNYYRPKRTTYRLGSEQVIYIPEITTNYSELVDIIKQRLRPHR